tara:strand:- start:171 stop:746 length:576 start_codon:yes stop_codon:yes gene_type:complete
MVLNLGILISQDGSNMLNIVKACHEKKIQANVKIVISNNPDSKGLKKLKNFKTKSKILLLKDFKNKKAYEEKINELFKENNVNFICLAGYMIILERDFLEKWKKRVINIHPSLLPSFKGLEPQKQAIQKKVKFSGCTVHYVNDNIDDGEIIDQSIVKVDKKETVESLKKKILLEEHKLYISVLIKISKVLK